MKDIEQQEMTFKILITIVLITLVMGIIAGYVWGRIHADYLSQASNEPEMVELGVLATEFKLILPEFKIISSDTVVTDTAIVTTVHCEFTFSWADTRFVELEEIETTSKAYTPEEAEKIKKWIKEVLPDTTE